MLRAIESHMIRKAGFTRARGARGGAITFIQRFGSAVNLNLHLHMLIPDGVYTFEQDNPRFHRVNAPSRSELDTLLIRIITRITRHLQRDDLLVADEPQPYLDLNLNNAHDQLAAQSIQYKVIIGPNAGSRTLTL